MSGKNNIPPSTPPYVDTILLDCSRSNSEEKKGNNNSNKAIFTNKLGVGVRLNAGDKVSVHQGFVSDRGCGGDVIEFTGKSLNTTYEIEYTEQTREQPLNPDNEYPFGTYPPEGNMTLLYENKKKSFLLKDNEINLGISYFKSTNGEGYFHLPRRYDAAKNPFFYSVATGGGGRTGAPTSNLSGADAGGTGASQGWARLMLSNSSKGAQTISQDPVDTANSSPTSLRTFGIVAQYYDNYANGMASPPLFRTNLASTKDWGEALGERLAWQKSTICWDDYYFYEHGNYPQNKGDIDMDTNYMGKCEIDWVNNKTSKAVAPPVNYMNEEFINRCLKKKNDGTRYTIFKMTTCHRGYIDNTGLYLPTRDASSINSQQFTTPYADKTENGYAFRGRIREPAINDFIKYQEIKNLKVPAGYNAPSNVSEELTNQLNTTESPSTINIEIGGGLPNHTAPVPENIKVASTTSGRARVGTSVDAGTYKPFNCATSVSFQKLNQFIYNDPTIQYSDAKTPHSPSGNPPPATFTMYMADYLSSYETIAFKRPDFVEAGRNLMKEIGGIWTYATEEVFPEKGVWTLKRRNRIGRATIDKDDGMDISNLPIQQIIYPCIAEDVTPTNHSVIKTSIPWTEDNLKLLKTYFDTQGGYPELFESLREYEDKITSNNCRFFHMNQGANEYTSDYNTTTHLYSEATHPEVYPQYSLLGDDGMDRDNLQTNAILATAGGLNMTRIGQNQNSVSQATGEPHTSPNTSQYYNSIPLPFYRDEARAEEANGGESESNLYYGMFKRVAIKIPRNPHLFTQGSAVEDKYYWAVAITTDGIGFNQQIFNEIRNASGFVIERYRTIGYDLHFNGYGNASICLYAGYLDSFIDRANPSNLLGHPFKAVAQDTGTTYRDEWIFQNWRQYYCGANNPLITFDTQASRFSFQQLYTAEQIGNVASAGNSESYPVIDDADSKVYKVNKNLLAVSYAPDMIPYLSEIQAKNPTGGVNAQTSNNLNIFPFSVMDSHGGIFLENMAVPENKWDESLWGILGFSYNQFNSSTTLSRQTRINDVVTIDNIGKPTTNANIVPSTLNEWVVNQIGVPLYSQQIPPSFRPTTETSQMPVILQDAVMISYPSINVTQTSAQINAEKLPRKMLRPYFLIKSDIIDNVSYIGGEDSGQNLPVIYVVNKENAFGDFFFQADSPIEFTITRPNTISSITTSIHNPDMTLATLTDDSSIIYKITKMNKSNLMPFAQILAESQKK